MFSRFWSTFTIIVLNSFSGKLLFSSFVWFGYFYHVLSPSRYFSAFLFCLVCCVWGLLSAGLEGFISSYLWVGLDPLCGVGPLLVKVSCLGELVLHSGEWSWTLSLCRARKCPVVSFVVSVDLIWCVRYLVLQLALLEFALELSGSLVKLGFSVVMENFGW